MSGALLFKLPKGVINIFKMYIYEYIFYIGARYELLIINK